MPFLNVLGIFLKTILVLAILMGTGYLLARALNRRMKQIEEEEYIRESIGDENDHRLREARRPTRLTHAPRRNLSAESIRRIYAALIARAADAGLPRHLAETPYEFLPRLQHAFPEETDDVQTITEAYISVHYAEKPAAPEDVDRVRRVWKRVERFLKRKA